MNPIRRELLNGLFVLVVASLLSVAFAAFQVSFNALLWTLVLLGVAVAVSGYVVFELTLGFMSSTEGREKEWLKRVGTPARLELNREGEGTSMVAIAETIRAISLGGTYTVMYYFGSEGGAETPFLKGVNVDRERAFSAVLERLKHGTLSEYKRVVCFDHEVFANDLELRSGVLRVGEVPGTVDRAMGEHCRLMMETKGCSLYVATAVVQLIVSLDGVDKISIAIPTIDPKVGGRALAGVIFFSDPPNGEIIEQFRQIERATERRVWSQSTRFASPKTPRQKPRWQLVDIRPTPRTSPDSLARAVTKL
jgi:hypothetical protein